MKRTLKSVAILLTGVLVLGLGSNACAEDVSKGIVAELTRQLIQALPKEVVQEIKKKFIEEMKKELIGEARSVPNSGMKPVEITAVLAQASGQSDQTDTSDAINKLAAVARQYLNRDAKVADRVASEPAETRKVERLAKGDFIAVVTNQLNPVTALTMDQIRKLFSGQYTNWKDVGGPDMDVRVLTWAESTATLESLLKTSVAPTATRAKFVSLVIPLVDRSRGAIGFLPTQNVEQADFLLRHDAIKKIAIKRDEQSPAVTPSRLTLADGTYPMLSGGPVHAVAWSAPAGAAQDRPSSGKSSSPH